MARLILILAGVAALVLVAAIIARLLAPLEPAAPRPGSAAGAAGCLTPSRPWPMRC